MRRTSAMILVILVFTLLAAVVRADEQPLPRAVSAPVAELLAMKSDPVGSLFAPVRQTEETADGGGGAGGREFKESNPIGAAYMIAGATTLAIGLIMESFVGYLLAGVGLGVGIYGAVIYF